MTRHEFCMRAFFASIELLAFALTFIVVGWYYQSKLPVVNFYDNPGYRILDVTESYIEVKWVNAALVTDCHGRVEPIIWGEHASYALPSYPFVVQHERKTFVRRYEIPKYFPPGDYQLRINMISHCNPLFEGRQILRVDFRYDPRGVME